MALQMLLVPSLDRLDSMYMPNTTEEEPPASEAQWPLAARGFASDAAAGEANRLI